MQEIAAMGQLIGDMAKAGVLIATDGLVGEGESEIRLMHDAPAMGPESGPGSGKAEERRHAEASAKH